MYPLRFEPEQSVSFDLGRERGGEGRAGQGYSVHALS